ncbi:MAG: NAD(P)-dependent glycerol-3-phosphate dehydrogenase [Methylacidiphilales bacterium]|nr:NAD(P)-dependent glycerol-3-phosphate dehydrogenase [Candidatus Methylacidiphilales bacterium]MDW8350014.1 NAD(P)H-dependent glycerol-3-phosphate dehydrogenase [Verrucomicrobiae bacterium]
MKKTITVLGAGAWGRTLSRLLQNNGHTVHLRHHDDLSPWPDQDGLMIAIPVQHIRHTINQLPPPHTPICSLSKGIEIGTGKRVTQIIRETWPDSLPLAVLSGPNLAHEITQGLPAASTLAAEDTPTAIFWQTLLHQPLFRIYRCPDIIGVELGGALKNIYAIAGGVCRGLGLGENALAALLTRSSAEMTRIGLILGGQLDTFRGLSGIGDLFLTATSRHSRNARVGELLVQGKPLPEILQSLGGVAEGVTTARAIYNDPRLTNCEKPIANEIYAMLYENKPVQKAVEDLLDRIPSVEN